MMIASIDAGHGGMYPRGWAQHGKRCTGGAYNGIVESDTVLKMALNIEAKMLQRGGTKPVLTRTGDIFLGLEQRAAIAHDVGADCAVSLHVNGHPQHSEWRGLTLYHVPEDVVAKKMAARIARHCPVEFARVKIVFEATDLDGPEDDWLQRPRAVLMPYYRAGIPCVLCEIGFSSNATDARLLRDSETMSAMEDAIIAGIDVLGEMEG